MNPPYTEPELDCIGKNAPVYSADHTAPVAAPTAVGQGTDSHVIKLTIEAASVVLPTLS